MLILLSCEEVGARGEVTFQVRFASEVIEDIKYNPFGVSFNLCELKPWGVSPARYTLVELRLDTRLNMSMKRYDKYHAYMYIRNSDRITQCKSHLNALRRLGIM